MFRQCFLGAECYSFHPGVPKALWVKSYICGTLSKNTLSALNVEVVSRHFFMMNGMRFFLKSCSSCVRFLSLCVSLFDYIVTFCDQHRFSLVEPTLCVSCFVIKNPAMQESVNVSFNCEWMLSRQRPKNSASGSHKTSKLCC